MAALRIDGVAASYVIDGAMDGPSFLTYIEQVLVPTLRKSDIVFTDQPADSGSSRSIPLAEVRASMAGGAENAADYVRLSGYRVNDQISIFSAISIASSTSMPR